MKKYSIENGFNFRKQQNTPPLIRKGPTLMLPRSLFKFILTLTLTLTLFPLAWGEEQKPVKPSSKDKCPVCGMFVAKYPDWIAQIFFNDGSYIYFDGAKDLFKYLFDLKKYNPSKKSTDIKKVYVTDYYDLIFIDGREAFYIMGSDVYGPMGRELIPFKTEPAAREFMRDHKGKFMLRFQEVTAETIKNMD
jgi:copper chaperone NosL